jgi:hypothetical protein
MEPLKIGYYLQLVDFYMRFGMKTKAMDVYQQASQRAPDAEQIKEAIRSFDERHAHARPGGAGAR